MKPLLFICIFFVSVILFAQPTKRIKSNWVELTEFDQQPKIDESEITGGYTYLLLDDQINIPLEEYFKRKVIKITENIGVQNASNISIDYDPNYQKLVFHSIDVIRNDSSIDKLNLDHIQTLRRESNAESYIYDGTMSAIINLPDIRNGDILDYSYSIIGFNPVHKGMFTAAFLLNDSEPMGKVNVSIISVKPLITKLYNIDLEPSITEFNGFKKYNWVKLNYDQKLIYEKNTPSWKMTYANLFVSDIASWSDVVDWGVDTYSTDEDFNQHLQEKIKTIEENSKNEGDKITSTLSFVQDEIRYLSLSEGISAYKPHHPNEVFDQRYGDCKDKSLLMVSMLRAMEIEAYPMLVNTNLNHIIKELPPSPKVFDHCVVKVIDNEGNTTWYDPTIANQGGVYGNFTFPAYFYGLVLRDNNSEFDSYFPISDNLIETFDEYKMNNIGYGASLEVKTIYHQAEADNMRAYFKANSLSSIQSDLESYYSNHFNSITSIAKPKFEDDSLKNLFTVYEAYKLDSIWGPYGNDENIIATSFTPYTINDVLLIPDKSDRKFEYALYYPSTRRHKIKVRLPTNWNIRKSSDFVSDKNFYFSIDIDYNRSNQVLDLNYYYKNQEPYVKTDDFSSYYKNINLVGNQNAYYISIPKSEISSGSSFTNSPSFGNDEIMTDDKANKIVIKVFGLIAIVLLLAIVLGVVIFVISKNRA